MFNHHSLTRCVKKEKCQLLKFKNGIGLNVCRIRRKRERKNRPKYPHNMFMLMSRYFLLKFSIEIQKIKIKRKSCIYLWRSFMIADHYTQRDHSAVASRYKGKKLPPASFLIWNFCLKKWSGEQQRKIVPVKGMLLQRSSSDHQHRLLFGNFTVEARFWRFIRYQACNKRQCDGSKN